MDVPETVLAAMRQTNDLFDSEVVRKRNIDALDRIYTVNARILPPGADMLAGREQIKSFWQQAIVGLGLKGARLTTVDAEALAESVLEIGRADLTVGEGQTISVKYVVRWKEEDGNWKWHIDIWNLSQ
jgi:ketosteroid isomerase-like protein